jgi:transposase InsO family protein
VIAMGAQEYPVRVLCQLLSCAPSSYYYRPHAQDETTVRDLLERIALEFPRYGYRRMTAELHRRGALVNHKRVLHLMREESLLVQVKRYVRTTFSQHKLGHYPNLIKDLTPAQPNHIWCGDITYIRLQAGFVYLAVLMDVFTRAIRGWHLGCDLTEALVCTALERALAAHPAPRIHHSDQGVQYAAHGDIACLAAHGVQISMAAVGRPTENAYAERLIRTLKEEEVYLNEYADYQEAYRRIGHFLDQVYMTKRIHSALGYLTPAEFEARSDHHRAGDSPR